MNIFYTREQENELIETHTPLVVSIAYSFTPKPPNDYDDLISIGKIGLLKAIRVFDPSKGYQFSTLATKIISREIIRELEKTNGKNQENLDFDIQEETKSNFDDYIPDYLSDTEKKILILRFHLGYTFKEIGKELGYTKQWANAQFSNILKKILESNEKKKNIVAE